MLLGVQAVILSFSQQMPLQHPLCAWNMPISGNTEDKSITQTQGNQAPNLLGVPYQFMFSKT